MTSLLDGNVDVQTSCALSQDLVAGTPPSPYGTAVCDTDDTDPDDTDPVDMSENGGCSTGSGSTSGALLAIITGLLLFVRRKIWMA
ncbi:MAG: hypothetical protein JKY56_08515 [Kofleriaceae bacterium]|nr:hypothetical protein [Kofleriaceae bacterium]